MFTTQELKDLYIAIKIHTEELKILANMTGQELNQQRHNDLITLTEKMKDMYEYQSKQEGIDPRLLEDSISIKGLMMENLNNETAN